MTTTTQAEIRPPVVDVIPLPGCDPADAVGLLASAALAMFTMAAFAAALFAVPVSGANCPGQCVDYPYLATLHRYPRDFVWMGLAIPALAAFVVVLGVVSHQAAPGRRLFSVLARQFGTMSALVLMADYFLQMTVVPMSLKYGETDGLALLIQYNPHGLFLMLEELGYYLMLVTFAFLAAALPRTRRPRLARWGFAAGAVVGGMSAAVLMVAYGLDRADRLEIVVLSICWLVLIVSGSAMAVHHARNRRRGVALGQSA